ncbi:unnamed protein product [Blepharisma stoltei]|uniref:Uncharacterized protein n=1 Tax=Blepharisma stoltei TaxID=1481888 RepID=A0AAU9JN13_9CILI|nr:unnamed protein product [Blepharisma stoltei]
MINKSPISSNLEKRGLTSSLTFSHSTSSLFESNKPSKHISQKRIEQESLSRRTLDPTFPERPIEYKQGKKKINPAHNNNFWDKSSASSDFEARSNNPTLTTSRDNPLSGEVFKVNESPKKPIRSQKYLESQISWQPESKSNYYAPSIQNKVPKTASSIDFLPGSFFVKAEDNHKSQKRLNPLKYETSLFNSAAEKPSITGRYEADDSRSQRK